MQLWAVGRYDLGLTEAEFWELSFKGFDLLSKRQALAQYRAWERTAGLMCMVYNVHRSRRQRALKVKDILKNPFEKKQTARDMARFLEELTRKQGGTVYGGKSAEH